jgi:lipopolysaccharide export system protein LptC
MIDARRLALGVALAALAAASWWFTRDAAQPPSAADAKTRHDPDYFVERFTATAMNELGSPQYVLTADRMTHYPDDDTAHYVKPVLVQYKATGARITTRGDTGVMPGDGREIVLDGNVHAVQTGDPRSAGGEIIAEHLRVVLDR